METENEEITSPVQTTNSSSSLESLIEKNWKTLSFIIVASLIIFAALYFYKASNDDKALARGQELVTVSMDDSSISSLLEFASTNEGTVSGNNAKLIIAERYTNGDSPDLDKAKQYLSEFIATADQTNPFYYDAKFSLATLLEKTGNAKEAKTIFETLQSTVEATPQKSPKSLSEAIGRRNTVLRATRKEAPASDPLQDRMKRLAGIK